MPCLRRAASVEEEYEAAGGEVLLDGDDNDGWLATHGKPKGIHCCWTGGLVYCALALILIAYAFTFFFSRKQI